MVGKRKVSVIWDNAAKQFFKDALDYISQNSPQNAAKIGEAIVLKIEDLSIHPARYPLDKCRLNNTGDYCAFETFGFRISYFVSETQVRIVRVKHSKQHPESY